MNGEQLPLLNGFPLRLAVPGWYSTYWVKMLSDVEVLDRPDDQFWMAKAYLVPDTPGASVKPGETGYRSVPISRMVLRSFVTNLRPGSTVRAGARARHRVRGRHGRRARGLFLGRRQGLAAGAARPRRGQVQLPAMAGRVHGARAFPDGPGVGAINGNCLACHSAGVVLNQPAMPRAAWEAEVAKMVNVYKAPVAAEDVPAIVAYLDAVKGLPPAR